MQCGRVESKKRMKYQKGGWEVLIPMCKSGQLTFLKAGIIYMHFGVLLIVFKVNKDPRTKTVGPSKNLKAKNLRTSLWNDKMLDQFSTGPKIP